MRLGTQTEAGLGFTLGFQTLVTTFQITMESVDVMTPLLPKHSGKRFEEMNGEHNYIMAQQTYGCRCRGADELI